MAVIEEGGGLSEELTALRQVYQDLLRVHLAPNLAQLDAVLLLGPAVELHHLELVEEHWPEGHQLAERLRLGLRLGQRRGCGGHLVVMKEDRRTHLTEIAAVNFIYGNPKEQ